jgi:Cys-rich four helix bundle protein (predicted Tat secretion target)
MHSLTGALCHQHEEESMSKDTSTSATSTHGGAESVNRREFLAGAGAVAALTVSGAALGAATGKMHDHATHAPQHPNLLDAVNNCIAKGQTCVTHCLVSFKEGDTTLADCAAKVHEMDAICTAFSYLLAANSSYSNDYAKVCLAVCQDCEDECRKHEEKHKECKACAEACADVVAGVKKTFA